MTHLEVLSDLTNETLEGELADEQLGGLLVAPDFTERDGSGPETMRLLDTAGRGLFRTTMTNNNKAAQGQFGNAWKPATHSISSERAPRGRRKIGTYRRRRLPRSLGGELLTGGLAWKTNTC